MLLPQYYAPEKDQMDVKWLEKKIIFRRQCQRVGRSKIIVNKSIKETENLISLV